MSTKSPVFYNKLESLIHQEMMAQPRQKVNMNKVCTNVAVKFRLTRGDVKTIVKNFDTLFGINRKKPLISDKYLNSIGMYRLDPKTLKPIIKP